MTDTQEITNRIYDKYIPNPADQVREGVIQTQLFIERRRMQRLNLDGKKSGPEGNFWQAILTALMIEVVCVVVVVGVHWLVTGGK